MPWQAINRWDGDKACWTAALNMNRRFSMDEYYPIADSFWGFDNYIIPPDYPGETRPRPTGTQAPQAPSYETPWYVDTINRAIERASQVATIDVGGYPPYPSYPTPSPLPGPGAGPQPSGGIQLSTNTLMLLVGGFLLFTLGKRGR